MYKKILAILFGIAFLMSKVNASTLFETDKYRQDNEIYLTQKYEVSKSEEEQFVIDAKQDKSIYNKVYSFVDMSKTGGDETVAENISDKKEIVTISKNGNISITNLPKYIKYSKNGYNGNLKLDVNNIKTISKYDKDTNQYIYYITAYYIGNLSKIVEKPYIYQVRYKEVYSIEFMPLMAIGFILIIIVIYILRKNVKIYNLQYGKWVLIGKMRIKKPYINLDKLNHKNITSKYRIELSKNLTKKLYNKSIVIEKKNESIEKLVDKINDKFTFEINI
jgi:hypothetical protein